MKEHLTGRESSRTEHTADSPAHPACADMVLEHIRCNLCGRDDATKLFDQRDYFSSNPSEFAVVECRNCGLIYVNPRPSPADIHRFYTRDYIAYQFEIADVANPSLRERLISLVTRASARDKVRFVEGVLPASRALRVLDVGCGRAGFLDAMKRRLGCEVTGLDFDEGCVEYCRQKLGIPVIQGNVDALLQRPERYDLVTMWHFLEHDFDPLATLRKINASLEDRGVLIVEVPNARSLENRTFGRRSFLYDAPRHLYDFSPGTIATLLRKAGYTVERITYPRLSGGWIGSIQNVFWQGRMYRALRQHVYAFLALSQLIFPLEYVLSKTGAGSIMRVVARKQSAGQVA